MAIDETKSRRRVVPLINMANLEMCESVTTDQFLSGTGGANPRGNGWRALLLFVKFSDSNDTETTDAGFQRLIGGDQRENELNSFFYRQTGDESLKVGITVATGRLTLSGPSSSYRNAYDQTATHRAFIRECMELFNDEDYDAYDFLIISPSPTGGDLPGSASRADKRNYGITITPVDDDSNSSTIRAYVTLGDDAFRGDNAVKVLAHEIGHLFGFPDLYPVVRDAVVVRDEAAPRRTYADYSIAGPWGLMSDVVRARDYLEWHRFKAGWLGEANTVYLEDGTHSFSFDEEGIRMAVIPINDVANPTHALVLQAAPVIDSASGDEVSDRTGVIAYTVVSTVPSGASPIRLECPPQNQKFDPQFGNWYRSALQPGTTFGTHDGIVITINRAPSIAHGDSSSTGEEDLTVAIDRQKLAEYYYATNRKRETVDTVKIGDRVWTTENLRVNLDGAVCYPGKEEECDAYGRLYTFPAAVEACAALGPEWRIPTDDDWRALSQAYGGAYLDDSADEGRSAYQALKEGGESGFNAKLGGKKFYFPDREQSYFYDFGEIGYYWTATPRGPHEMVSYTMRSWDNKLLREWITNESMISLRCVRDAGEQDQ